MQLQKQKQTHRQEEPEEIDLRPARYPQENEDLDDLLEDIDDALDEYDAQEVVNNFVQKGGE